MSYFSVSDTVTTTFIETVNPGVSDTLSHLFQNSYEKHNFCQEDLLNH